MSTDLSAAAPAALASNTRLGEYTLGQPLWRLRIADAYKASGPSGAVTVLVINAHAAATPGVIAAVERSANQLAAIPEHKHLARTLGVGRAGDTVFVVIEEVDGSNVRDVLARKRQTGAGGGFGARGAGNLVAGIAGALAAAGVPHGAIASESVVVSKSGRVRVVDMVLGPATAIAVRAGMTPNAGYLAPEVAAGGPTSQLGDVYGLGALLYEALIGRPLERGGPRPSEAVPNVTAQLDELIARACHRDPERRFGSTAVFRELVSEALGRGGALEAGPGGEPSGSISGMHSIPPGGARASGQGPAMSQSLAESIATSAVSGSGSAVTVDRALQAALADSTEKWLISKGRLDYGPFSLADVVKQIEKGDVVAGNVIVDKDTGARLDVAKHPLLSAMIDAAKQAKDDARRAQAEVAHHGREKRRSVMLFAVIAVGVAALGVGVYFIIDAVSGGDDRKAETVSGLGDSELNIKMSPPKKPPKRARSGGGASGGGGGGRPSGGTGGAGLGGNADQTLDLSGDDEDGSETLSMDEVYKTYSKYGGGFARCLGGGGAANISIIIDGKSGKVTWLRVNGQNSGSLFNCIGGVMKQMKFKSINGPRTRAEFDIEL